ncbi:Avirulence (Avh) protein [Phytophthora megakarya]|uniref:RxLR effector protein n=1 Tax=Phytophthora megakarya TaxID=4795 RepID=A0A225VPB0_9STRA|nr:Avirulence (Avh) protein [Phytophthora megakarya]
MRCAFYVAIAIAVLARSNVITAFANTGESNLLSMATPDFATDAVISQKRFLRVADPQDTVLMRDDEERMPKLKSLSEEGVPKIKLLSDVFQKLDKVKQAPKKAVEGAKKVTKFTQKELDAAAALLKLKDKK